MFGDQRGGSDEAEAVKTIRQALYQPCSRLLYDTP
jgi:hypothetical protein